MKKGTILWLVVGVLFIVGVVWLILTPGKPGQYDEFASCINDSGTTYFGAFWCPNCQNQEALFGRSAEHLPRIECSTPDGRGQLQVCQDEEIEAYPTWEFADGSRQTGVLSLQQLSERTSCPLPGQEGSVQE